jgi:uncharacterized protein YjdB
MRKMFFLMLTLIVLSVASMNAQVTIGSAEEPTPGTVLDLQSGGSLGLLLPNVKLTDETEWLPMDGLAIDGMQVFTDGSGGVSPGVYVWFNDQWNILVQSAITDTNIPVSGVGVNPTSYTLTAIGETTTLHSVIVPSNATNQTVSWSDNGSPYVTVNPITGEVTADADGTATVTVTTLDGNFSASATITVDVEAPPTPLPVCSTVPYVAGYNYLILRHRISTGGWWAFYTTNNIGNVTATSGPYYYFTWTNDNWVFTASGANATIQITSDWEKFDCQ